MAYQAPHPNQAAIDRARYGVAFQLGDEVVIWRGRWCGESGQVIAVGISHLHVQTIAGGVVRVFKSICCLIVDGPETDEEYGMDDSDNGFGIEPVSDGSDAEM
jgi:hypothetical protein